MKKLIQFTLMIIIGLVVNACYYDAFPEDEIDPDDDNGDGTETPVISYQNDIVPLWVQCTGCHKAGGDEPNMEDNSYNNLLNGYVVPGDAAASILYKSLLGDGAELMPPGSAWPASKSNLVRNWIDQGALDN